jgi:hypothetical protein
MTTVRVNATAGHGDHGKSTLCAGAETRSRDRGTELVPSAFLPSSDHDGLN